MMQTFSVDVPVTERNRKDVKTSGLSQVDLLFESWIEKKIFKSVKSQQWITKEINMFDNLHHIHQATDQICSPQVGQPLKKKNIGCVILETRFFPAEVCQ